MRPFEKRLDELKGQKIVVFDAETNGLWGQPFTISAIAYDENGKEVSRFIGRCPIREEVDPWIQENILPHIEHIEKDADTYDELLKNFIAYLLPLYKEEGYRVLCHMGHVIEARIIQDAFYMGNYPDPFSGPYEWYDACMLFGDSTDRYMKEHDIPFPEGKEHDPIYDCQCIYAAYRHFVTH